MISIFGVILIVSIIIYTIKNIKNEKLGKNLYFLSIVSLLFIDIGYIAQIGTITIEYNYLFSIINLIFAIYYFIKNFKTLEKKDIIIISSFFLVMILSMVYPLIFNLQYKSVSFNNSWDLYFGSNMKLGNVGFSTHALGMLARVIIFVLSFYAFSKSVTKEEIKGYSKKMYQISWVIIGISIIEFIITNFIDNFAFRNFAFLIFGKSDSTYILPRLSFGNLFTPMAFMREPSSYVRAIFILGINNVYAYKTAEENNRKRIFINIAILMIIMLVSKSLSGYIYIAALALLIVYSMKSKKVKITGSILVPIIVIVMCIISKDRIQKIFESFQYFNMEPSQIPLQSEMIRFYSINNNFKLFLSNFLIGCGFGTVYSYSAIITLIANIGIIGTGMYLYTLNHISNIAVKRKFFSWITFVILLITGLFIGHMSYVTYLETFAYQIIILKSLDNLIYKEK